MIILFLHLSDIDLGVLAEHIETIRNLLKKDIAKSLQISAESIVIVPTIFVPDSQFAILIHARVINRSLEPEVINKLTMCILLCWEKIRSQQKAVAVFRVLNQPIGILAEKTTGTIVTLPTSNSLIVESMKLTTK